MIYPNSVAKLAKLNFALALTQDTDLQVLWREMKYTDKSTCMSVL